MNYPITAAEACRLLLLVATSGRSPEQHLALAQQNALTICAGERLLSVQELVEEISEQGDEKDRRIARLEGALMHVESRLGDWLTDNTDEVFEEEPEIDGLRGTVQDVLDRSKEG